MRDRCHEVQDSSDAGYSYTTVWIAFIPDCNPNKLLAGVFAFGGPTTGNEKNKRNRTVQSGSANALKLPRRAAF